MSKITGVDLSHWNGSVDFAHLAADFVLLKVGGSDSGRYTDRAYASNAKAARAAKKHVGHYWFNGEGDPVSDADFFSGNLIAFQDGDLCVLDIEGENGVAGTPWDPQKALAFLREVKRKRPTARLFVYMSSSVTNEFNWTDVAKLADLWVANYGPNNGSMSGSAPSVGYWKSPTIWQYTSMGRIAGVSGNVDLDTADSSLFSGPTPAPHTPAVPPPFTKKEYSMYIKTSDGAIWAVNPIAGIKHHISAPQWQSLSQFDHQVISVTDAQAAAFTTV